MHTYSLYRSIYIYSLSETNTIGYYATDNLVSPAYRGLTPEDLIDITVLHGLHYDVTTQEGVMFHLIGALSEFGKIGVVCVAADHARALALYQKAVAALEAAGTGQG